MQRKNGIVSFNPDQVEPCLPKHDELLHPILGTFSLKTTDMRFAFFCNSQFIRIQLYGHESIIWVLTGFKLRMELELFPQWNEGVLSERKQPWVFRPRLLVPFFVPFNPFNFQAPRFVIDRPDTTGTFILENPYVKARWRDSCFFECEFSLVVGWQLQNLDVSLQRKGMFLQTRVPWVQIHSANTRRMQAASWTSPLALKVPLLMSWWGWWVDFQQKSLWFCCWLLVGGFMKAPHIIWQAGLNGQGIMQARVVKPQNAMDFGIW